MFEIHGLSIVMCLRIRKEVNMGKNVDKMEQKIISRSNLFEVSAKGTKDEYNIYKEHIQYVYKYVCLLSKCKS